MATSKPDLTRSWASGAAGGNVIDPDVTTPGKFAAGWIAEVPPFEHQNYLQQTTTQGLAHANEQGIMVWDTDTTYPIDGIAKGSDGRIFIAIVEQNGNDPVSDGGANWVPWQVGTKNFNTMANAISAKAIKEDDVLLIKDRFNRLWDVVLAASVTPNTFNIVQCTGQPLLALVLRFTSVAYVEAFVGPYDGSTNTQPGTQIALDSGASIVQLGHGTTVISSVLNLPNFVSLIGYGIPTVNDTEGTTLLYDGTGECVRSVGLQNVVPFINGKIENFRIRKVVQASPLAAIALVSGSGIDVSDIRIDTDSNAYNFEYGVVCDQSEVMCLKRVDVQGSTGAGIMTAAFFFTNGAQYTIGNNTNFTNAITMYDCNANSADYGVLHDGGEGFKMIGGNMNGAHIASVRMSGLNSFSIDTVYMEGSSGTADILIAQLTSDAQTVGAGGGGTIKNCRLASTATNCIRFENNSIQTEGYSIYGNKFGSGRTGSAISVISADSLRNSMIGPNVNLGGGAKNYLDDDVYDNNSVSASNLAQLEDMETTFTPGTRLSTLGNGRVETVTRYNRTTGTPYVVLETDHHLLLSNNAGVDLDVTLPSGAAQDGRILTFTQILGANNINIDTTVLNAVGETVTMIYDHVNTSWVVLKAV